MATFINVHTVLHWSSRDANSNMEMTADHESGWYLVPLVAERGSFLNRIPMTGTKNCIIDLQLGRLEAGWCSHHGEP